MQVARTQELQYVGSHCQGLTDSYNLQRMLQMDGGRLRAQRKRRHARREQTINRAKIGYEKEDGKDELDCQCGWL